jgi:hypothetical protein
VRDVGERAKLALEAQQGRGVEPRHRLERDDLAALDVARPVHHTHAALAEVPLDDEALVAAEFVDGPEHPSSRRCGCRALERIKLRVPARGRPR